MPDHQCVATAISRVSANLSSALRFSEGSEQHAVVAKSMHQLCDSVLEEAAKRIGQLEQEVAQQRLAVEQLQDVLQSLIEKPK